MRTEDELVKLYFFRVPAAMILDGRINYQDFPQHELMELMRSYQKEYSETESTLLYQKIHHATVRGMDRRENSSNIFLALVHVAEELLCMDHNTICCRYSQLQYWRDISRYLGESLLVCAYLARDFQNTGIVADNFCWDMVLTHTNKQLNMIMKQGISENHFHLFGSAPVFPLIWIKLMNDINNKCYIQGLQGMDKHIRNQHTHFDRNYREDSTECMVLQAALMRAAMFAYLNGKQDIFEGSRIRENNRQKSMFWRLMESLRNGNQIMERKPEIRLAVNCLKSEAMLSRKTNLTDYALETIKNTSNINVAFAGERKLVYQMLCDILVEKRLPEEIRGLLYPYLVIRTAVRGKLVQNNDNLGFENFAVYSAQKKNFISGQREIKTMVKHAVLSSFRSDNLKSLEIRISPLDNYLEDARLIRQYDRLLADENHLDKEKFYYIYHFSKKADKNDKIDKYLNLPCRDNILRRQIKKKGNAILLLRQRMPEEASRLKGIDACAQEIGCRPEVFAPIFRQLRNHVVSCEGYQVPQLRITYHVGEDFLDMADGLRAIDEAVHFLGMRNGDRLGHATVLGFNAKTWYERKHGRIILFAQDYLDNVAWMHNKLLECKVSDCDLLKSHLLKEFMAWVYRIYGEDISTGKIDIFTYARAWKLRGDLPELYKKGCYQPDLLEMPNVYSTTPDFPMEWAARKKLEIAKLYYQYHFDKNVREAGREIIEVQIPDLYVEGVQKIQKEMQWQIARKGIGIETNPSSNLAISGMKNYAEHPIINLYSLGLPDSGIEGGAQMFVSVNTDDQGVFHTSLENEYALLASMMENMHDKQGNMKYSPQEVYDWLDRIRRMGNQQVFD